MLDHTKLLQSLNTTVRDIVSEASSSKMGKGIPYYKKLMKGASEVGKSITDFKVEKKVALIDGIIVCVVKRDTSKMPGKQDKYTMLGYEASTKKVVVSFGSHPTVDGGKKWIENNLSGTGSSRNEEHWYPNS